MAEGCLFCKIVNGDIPANIVYQDEHTCAFLDAHPLVKGHTLVVPVRHHTRLHDLEPKAAMEHLGVFPRIVNAVEGVMRADGVTVAWNDGPAAGQEVPHLHAHIVPRYEEDIYGPIHRMFTERPTLSDTDTKHIAERLETALSH